MKFLLICFSIASFAWADNAVYSLYPAATLQSVLYTATVIIDPLSGDSLANDSGIVYPGVIYGFCLYTTDSTDVTAPFLTAVAPGVGQTTGDLKPDLVVLISDASPIDTGTAILKIDSLPISNAVKKLSNDTLRFVLASPLLPGWHSVQISIEDTAGNLGDASWGFKIQTGAPIVVVDTSDEINLVDPRYLVRGTISSGDTAVAVLNGVRIISAAVDPVTKQYDFNVFQLPAGRSVLTIYGISAAGETTYTKQTTLLYDNIGPTAVVRDGNGRLRNDTLLTGIAEIVMLFSDPLSGLDTSTLALKVNGQSSRFNSIRTTAYGAGKRSMAAAGTIIGEVEGIYHPPVLSNHSLLILQAEIKDNLGNTMRDSLALVVVKSDSLPPKLTFPDTATSIIVDQGSPFSIRFAAADSTSKLYRLRLRIVPTGETQLPDSLLTITESCTTSSSDSMSATINWGGPLFAGILKGFSYQAEAMDEFGNMTASVHRGVRVRYNDYRHKSLTDSVWQMFSVPLAQNATAESLQAHFGAPDPKVWRWARYANGTLTEHGVTAGFDSIVPGRAFWIHHRFAPDWQLPTGRAVSLSPADTFTMPLVPGWNQVGNPYLFDLKWEQFVFSAAESLVGYPYVYDASVGEYHQLNPSDPTAKLSAWGGFWLCNRSASTVWMKILPSFACTTLAKRSTAPGWTSPILAFTRKNTSKAFIGERPSAKPGRDAYDAYLPPTPDAGRLRIALQADSLAPLSGSYSNFTAGKPGETFSLVCWNAPESDSLWISAAPSHYPRLVLWDADIGTQCELSGPRVVAKVKGVSLRHFEIWAGTDEYIAANLELAQNRFPGQLAMCAYPNPFNPVVRIDYDIPQGATDRLLTLRLYHTNGALLKTLVSSPAIPGRYHVSWNGEVRPGVHAASGFYLLRLECSGPENKVLNQKLLLLK